MAVGVIQDWTLRRDNGWVAPCRPVTEFTTDEAVKTEKHRVKFFKAQRKSRR